MSAPDVLDVVTDPSGYWQVLVRTPSGMHDITTVRGVPTTVSSVSSTDPFGPASATLTFPGLTILDAIGENDLSWWRAGADVDIRWIADVAPERLVRTSLVWEGYIAGESTSFADDAGSMSMTLKGALRMADNTLAVPEFPQRPLTFEFAIAHSLDRARNNGARFAALSIEWPVWWTTRYSAVPDDKWWMVPVGVGDGEPWTAMVTRETGQHDQTLSSYVQGLLTSMHTARGQFTLTCEPGRRPVLRHRDRIGVRATAEIDVVTPGFRYEGSVDYESKANVVYGNGRSLDGISFSNMQYTMRTGAAYYSPFAYSRSVHPPDESNPAWDPTAVRREVWLQFYEGMSPAGAAVAARDYQRRFAAAGHTGTITLSSDPYVQTDTTRMVLARHTIVAGDVLRVRHFRGRPEGVLFLVTEANHDLASGTTTLSVDTVFRDALTSTEVRLRGRDALTSSKLLTVGSYQPSIRDQLLPWGQDSGYLPVASRKLVDDALTGSVSAAIPFPWEQMVRERPPKDPRWADCYVRLGPADPVRLANNWSTVTANASPTLVALSQAGGISLLQVMAVDRNGERVRAPFHISFYYNESTCAADMPQLDNTGFAHPIFGTTIGPYPFFPGAWETINADGTLPANSQLVVPAEGVGLISALGGSLSPGGYYPGALPDGDPPTGLLALESPFTYDVAGFDKDFDPYDASRNSFSTAGIVQTMIYCDSVWDPGTSALVARTDDVYFIGRLFRTPPGTG